MTLTLTIRLKKFATKQLHMMRPEVTAYCAVILSSSIRYHTTIPATALMSVLSVMNECTVASALEALQRRHK